MIHKRVNVNSCRVFRERPRWMVEAVIVWAVPVEATLDVDTNDVLHYLMTCSQEQLHYWMLE